ncbi:MAG: hypothetical protein K2H98_08285 [Duncaniella sp.]|nr:hypothetical protein [Duncaniella sp.]
MNRTLTSLIFFLIFFSSALSFNKSVKLLSPQESIVFDTIPYMVNDYHFNASYEELSKMFDGAIPYDLKRAEFLLENAFYDGKMDYNEYCHVIDSIVNVLGRFILINNISQYKTAPNFAIFEYMTKPSIMNGYRRFSYDFNDPFGQNNFSSFFTTKLINTHTGQCSSLSVFYKILCDELGGHSALALGPLHVYIKHIGEDGKWVNVELTNGSFTRDVWLIETMDVSTEAIRNGIFLCALNKKETIAYMIMLLAQAYQHKYDSYDQFVSQCIYKVINDLPNFTPALTLKMNYHQTQGLNYIEKYGYLISDFGDYHHIQYHSVISRLDSLGFSQSTPEEYNNTIKETQELHQKSQHE